MMKNTKLFNIEFMGNAAQFPAGIFYVAATFDAPILTMFAVKESYRHYKIYIQKLTPKKSCSKEEKALFLCSEYVKSLEKTLLQHPEQWYNFYPFWMQQK
jgi:predicted LPLAT superfamily acyltransferase